MKKLFVAAAALALTANVAFAQEQAGGNTAGNNASGKVVAEQAAATAVAVLVAAAIVSNSSGASIDTDVPVQPVPTCNQGDQLSGNVCITTSQTVTVTGSGTGTGTITVPVTSSYAPTVK